MNLPYGYNFHKDEGVGHALLMTGSHERRVVGSAKNPPV